MMCLKKCVLILSFSFFVAVSAFSSDMSFSFDVGLETGISIYGDPAVKLINNSIKNNYGNLVAVGAAVDFNLSIVKYLTVFVGSDFLSDFIWKNNEYFNHLDLAIFPGVKIYPGLKGFNLSLAYSFGTRFDFCAVLPKNPEERIFYAPVAWGNGFRLGVEYNFYYENKKRFLPSLGAYWRWMPRGYYHSDNILALYALVNF